VLTLDWTYALLGRRRFDWTLVQMGESGDLVYRRDDALAYAKIAGRVRAADLAGERDRIGWLDGRGVACPEIIDWSEIEEGACLMMTAVPGVPAGELSGADLLKAWPSMAQQLGVLHQLPTAQCPFGRSLLSMFERAADVVARNAVNPDFLSDEDKDLPAPELLARVERELSVRLDQEVHDKVVCHGDACMPNFMVDPASLRCTGLIDLGRLGVADRYVDLALMVANARERWASPEEEAQAFAILFDTLGLQAPDKERLAFYLRLDPLTWG
jgi:streptomycin 3"-kinase